MTTYRMTLSDGQHVEIKANNAGEAIETARRKHRGLTVAECYSGFVDNLRSGWIKHPPPPHEAIPEGAVLPKASARTAKVDAAPLMFGEAEIMGGRLAP